MEDPTEAAPAAAEEVTAAAVEETGTKGPDMGDKLKNMLMEQLHKLPCKYTMFFSIFAQKWKIGN